jgi:prepilin signal peptidase PulO-like enzyme (type II secretory pathway)
MIIFILSILIFFAGASMGSFFTVVIERMQSGEKGIIFGSSQCPQCHKNLGVMDLIPVLSYLILRGKCRQCHKKISKFYPLVELACGAYLVFDYLYFIIKQSLSSVPNLASPLPVGAQLTSFIVYGIIGLFVLLIAFYDGKYKEVPTLLLYLWIIACIIANFFIPNNLNNIAFSVALSLTFYGGQILLSRGKWLGSADLFFGVGTAILLGFEKGIVGMIMAYITGSLISVFLIITKILSRKSTIPFIPFLGIGTLIALFFGNEIVVWYINTSLFNFNL